MKDPDNTLEMLREMIRRWAPHCGLCCVPDASGKAVVTARSCVCESLHKRARRAAGMWPEEPKRFGWVAVHGSHFSDIAAGVFYADSEANARRLAAREWGVDEDDAELSVKRDTRLDKYIGKRTPEDVLREVGFTDEDGRTCDSCGLGDPSSGDNAAWRICSECQQCGECGCVCEEERKLCL